MGGVGPSGLLEASELRSEPKPEHAQDLQLAASSLCGLPQVNFALGLGPLRIS